jgi:hypothetical protein
MISTEYFSVTTWKKRFENCMQIIIGKTITKPFGVMGTMCNNLDWVQMDLILLATQ